MYRYIHINYPGSREKKGCHEKKLLPSRYTVAQPVAYKAGTPHRGASDASEDSELHTRNFQVCRGPTSESSGFSYVLRPKPELRLQSLKFIVFITGGPGTKLCAGERGEVRDM